MAYEARVHGNFGSATSLVVRYRLAKEIAMKNYIELLMLVILIYGCALITWIHENINYGKNHCDGYR